MKNLRFIALSYFVLSVSGVSLRGDELPEKITIASWNLEWFYDDYTGDNPSKLARDQSAPDKEEWEARLDITADAIFKLDPTILCLQEIESRRTVSALAKRLRDRHKVEYRVAFVEGSDVFTEQDVCILAKSGLVEFGRREQSKEMFESKEFYDLQKHIFARFEWGSGENKQTLTLLNVHLRAMQDQTEVRKRQAKLCRAWLNERIVAGENVVLIGDMNTNELTAETTNDGDIGILRGLDTSEASDDLFDMHALLAENDRATHIIHKEFDRILVSPALRTDDPAKKDFLATGMKRRVDLNTRGQKQDEDHWNIFYKIPREERDVSDHFPIIAEFELR